MFDVQDGSAYVAAVFSYARIAPMFSKSIPSFVADDSQTPTA